MKIGILFLILVSPVGMHAQTNGGGLPAAPTPSHPSIHLAMELPQMSFSQPQGVTAEQQKPLIDPAAGTVPITRGDAAWEEQVLLAFHRLSRVPNRLPEEPSIVNSAWSKMHHAFHASLIAGCDSRWLINFNAMLYDCAERYRNLTAVMGSDGRDVLGEHREIMEATINRKVDLATELLNEHYTKTTEVLMKASFATSA